jgi:hypothetical protein
MEITCQSCSTRFNARRDAKFCSARCRNRGHRLGGASVAEVVPLSGPDPAAPDVKPLVATVEKKLRAAERLETPAGQMALVLAERLAAGLDTGSALATLSKQLSSLLEDALAGAKVEPDALDELKARRERKAASA